jgi:hypothetical protein
LGYKNWEWDGSNKNWPTNCRIIGFACPKWDRVPNEDMKPWMLKDNIVKNEVVDLQVHK